MVVDQRDRRACSVPVAVLRIYYLPLLLAVHKSHISIGCVYWQGRSRMTDQKDITTWALLVTQ